jgi:Cu2+-exporting ATPase
VEIWRRFGLIVNTIDSLEPFKVITGESAPVDKTAGDKVIAGTVNGQGSVRVEVTGVGDQTALAGIMRLVEQAQSSRSRAQALADRAALLLTVVAIASAVVTTLIWAIVGRPWVFTIEWSRYW